MSVEAVARRYAAALVDVVIAQGEAREVQEELSAWNDMMGANDELAEVFRNPTIPSEQKQRVLDALIARARPRPTTANFLKLLVQNHRLVNLREINERFALELDRRSAVVSAHITTARPLPDAERERLQARLTEMTRSRVRLDFETDESLIGGVVTRIGSTIYDGSVRSQLQEIKERMIGAHH